MTEPKSFDSRDDDECTTNADAEQPTMVTSMKGMYEKKKRTTD
jgi:hypothetical protein